MSAGSLVLTQVSVHGSYFPDIFFGLLLCGLGIGLALVTASVTELTGVAGHEAGLASGLSNTALQIGSALGVAIVSTVAVSRFTGYLAANKGAHQRCSRKHQPKGEPAMGKIIVSENVSLDGVVQDPTGDEGFRVGGWVGLIKDSPQLNKLALDEALGAEAFLLGRRSYEWLAARWPSRAGELADRLNGLPKYVVSSTLKDPGWNNTTVLRGEVVGEVSKLKQQLEGDINVAASFQLLHMLIEHDLADELRLRIFPFVLGAGKRLFGQTSDKKPMRLIDAQTFEGGITYLTYQPGRDA
jgi:dihydrofolate reductase